MTRTLAESDQIKLKYFFGEIGFTVPFVHEGMVVGVVECEIIENIVLRANCIGVISTCRTVIPGKCDHAPPETKENFSLRGNFYTNNIKGCNQCRNFSKREFLLGKVMILSIKCLNLYSDS